MKKILMLFLITLITIPLTGCFNNNSEVDGVDFTEIYPENGVYYQLFVRSFADSDDDGVGDFNGITENLDYLVDLGIDGLWLMPIHPSPSYHGYDVIDFYDVNSEYGTMEDFENLLAEADKVGIKIIIDFVINHTSSQSDWFTGWLNGDSEYSGFYRKITSSDPRYSLTGSWGQGIWHSTEGGYYCGYFSPTMPDLNWSNEAVQDEMVEIGKFWLDKGVAGFRLDAALHLEGAGEVMAPTDPFISTLEKLEYFEYLLSVDYPDVYIVSEVFDSFNIYSKFFSVLDSSLEFETGDLIINAINRGYDTSYTSTLDYWYKTINSQSSDAIPAPFLKNHDQDRIASTWNSDFDKLSLAAEMYLTLPGNPYIYYGEELGMLGVKSTGPVWDETRRLPIPFGDSYETSWFLDLLNTSLDDIPTQQADNNSLYNVYKNIISARHDSLALSYGEYVEYSGSSSALVGYYRVFNYDEENQQAVLVLHNLSDEEVLVYEGGVELYYSDYDNRFDGTIAAQSTLILEIEGYDYGN